MPSDAARIAPAIQPTIACGPPIVATMIGIVMNGPMPHICVMLIVVPENRPIDRRKPVPRSDRLASVRCLLVSTADMLFPVMCRNIVFAFAGEPGIAIVGWAERLFAKPNGAQGMLGIRR